jgi:putative DNA primase/helicase
VFEDLHGYSDGASFSKALMSLCCTYYGTPARAFLKRLVDERDAAVALIEKFINEFTKAYVPPGADGQVCRVAKRFALVAAAGELATHFGITGWRPKDALNAAQGCFFDWLSCRGGIGSQEENVILSTVRRFFEQNGESQFTPWDAPQEHKTIKRAGFRRLDDGDVEFFVFPETFKSEIAKGFDPKLVSRICQKHGLLREGSKGEFTRSEQLPGMNKKTRCYRFTSKVIGGEE